MKGVYASCRYLKYNFLGNRIKTDLRFYSIIVKIEKLPGFINLFTFVTWFYHITPGTWGAPFVPGIIRGVLLETENGISFERELFSMCIAYSTEQLGDMTR